ncbi:MAG TPA: NADP-dependent oxidoreductase [Candidatus Aquilonibacter sp.]|nr:NADP-dependent oxidoreductase [Candidatus Aquilonibacter sp.]
MSTMKAVRVHEYGGPEALQYEDAPRPQPAPGEVLIRVHAAAINPVDRAMRQGYFKERIPFKLPFIPGWDVAGVVEAVGSGVSRLKPGDEVYGRTDLSRDGSYAEYMVARESEIALKPKSIDFVTAAAIPLAGLTAWQALFDQGQLSAGQTVLIHGGAGGVGHFAVQLAKIKGARVIATASARNHDFVRSLGADQVIDYNTTRFEDVVRDVDVVLDSITGDVADRSYGVIKKGGIYVSILRPPSTEKAAALGVRTAHTFVQANVAQLGELARLVDAGKLKASIEKVFPLAEAAAAHDLNAAGHTRGKIVLRVV